MGSLTRIILMTIAGIAITGAADLKRQAEEKHHRPHLRHTLKHHRDQRHVYHQSVGDADCSHVRISHGHVTLVSPGLMQIRCEAGFRLRGRKVVRCAGMKRSSKCVPINPGEKAKEQRKHHQQQHHGRRANVQGNLQPRKTNRRRRKFKEMLSDEPNYRDDDDDGKEQTDFGQYYDYDYSGIPDYKFDYGGNYDYKYDYENGNYDYSLYEDYPEVPVEGSGYNYAYDTYDYPEAIGNNEIIPLSYEDYDARGTDVALDPDEEHKSSIDHESNANTVEEAVRAESETSTESSQESEDGDQRPVSEYEAYDYDNTNTRHGNINSYDYGYDHTEREEDNMKNHDDEQYDHSENILDQTTEHSSQGNESTNRDVSAYESENVNNNHESDLTSHPDHSNEIGILAKGEQSLSTPEPATTTSLSHQEEHTRGYENVYDHHSGQTDNYDEEDYNSSTHVYDENHRRPESTTVHHESTSLSRETVSVDQDTTTSTSNYDSRTEETSTLNFPDSYNYESNYHYDDNYDYNYDNYDYQLKHYDDESIVPYYIDKNENSTQTYDVYPLKPSNEVSIINIDDEDYNGGLGSGYYEIIPKTTSEATTTSTTTVTTTSTPTITTATTSEPYSSTTNAATPTPYWTTTSSTIQGPTSRAHPHIPSDDEDLVEGSGMDGIAISSEGSGYDYEDADYYGQEIPTTKISIVEQQEIRHTFYYKHEADILRLDTSCTKEFEEAPVVSNGFVSRYDQQVPNTAMPGEFYSEAVYECSPGFKFEPEDIRSMFCSENSWVGRMPECVQDENAKVPGASSEVVCSSQQAAQCDQDCKLTANGTLATCSCFDGYEIDPWDNRRCKDIDECTMNNGGCQFKCVNKPGTFMCHCPDGYQEQENKCVDINECLLNNGHGPCQDRCTNTEGGYVCSCEGLIGTHLSSDNHTCDDDNGCNQNNGGCSHQCIDSYNQVFCLCPVGYQLQPDWKTCKDIDECKDKSLRCSQLCVNTPGSAHCECNPGFRFINPDKSSECEDINECTEVPGICGHGDCVNSVGSYKCECHIGFAPNVEGLCEDIDECQSQPCGPAGTCQNLPGSFECSCDLGYEFVNETCTDIDECLLGNPCINGNCINMEPGYECTCFDGFNFEDGLCIDIDECSNDPCGSSGTCSNTHGSFKCDCLDGFKFEHGTCLDIDECLWDPCGPHGDCVNSISSYECKCHPGFQFDANQGCIDIDECLQDENKCGSQGVCTNLPGSFECFCSEGFHLVNGTCEDVNECSMENGGCQHKCINIPGSFKCQCNDGFLVNQTNEKLCDDHDECSTGSHNCSHLCINQEGSHKCACYDGFAVNPFDHSECLDVNECILDNGGCDHNCTNIEGTYECSCNSGYQLKEQVKCQDIDECQIDSGGCSHLCINTPGSYECHCPPGYKLRNDGKTCKLVEKIVPCKSPSRPRRGYYRCNRRKINGFYAVGTKCKLRCRKGFRPSKPLKKKCSGNALWIGGDDDVVCEPEATCPAIPAIANGKAVPEGCQSGSSLIGTKCSFQCDPGFTLSGPSSTRCSHRQSWKGLTQMPMCKASFPEPFIICPSDITKSLPGVSTSVYVMFPQPKTNVDWFRYVDAYPPWAKQLEGEVTRGKHVITFRARSPVGTQSATCQMIIHVRDTEPPKVRECPNSFTEYLTPGQTSRRVTWKEPLFQDNVQIQHVMASYLPGHYFEEGRHHVLYQATDADGNKARCGFTITVERQEVNNHRYRWRHRYYGQRYNNNPYYQPRIPTTSTTTTALPSPLGSVTSGDPAMLNKCEHVPEMKNGRLECVYSVMGKRCSPVCDVDHMFYQKFTSVAPTFSCNRFRAFDWSFLPDCSPVHKSVLGLDCRPGWEPRGDICIACPPGMYRHSSQPLCQLCPKTSFSDDFGSRTCKSCPVNHSTKGLGSKQESDCIFERPEVSSTSFFPYRSRRKNRLGFMFYDRWMKSSKSEENDNHEENTDT